MTKSDWFDDTPVLGKMPPEEAAAKLREMGEDEAAETMGAEGQEATSKPSMMGGPSGLSLKPVRRILGPRPWQYTSHAFGYLAPTPVGDALLSIQNAGTIQADSSLKNSRIKITLDRLRVADYPGGSTHHVLFDFYAQNQVEGDVEHLHFNATYRVREGQQAAVVGYPIFVGLNVNPQGIFFRCFTVNVKNDADEAFLNILEGDAFKGGMQLAATAQPLVGTFSSLAMGLTKVVAGRNRNVAVQDIYMGLDFSNIAMRARLAEGSYIAVQIPEQNEVSWDWSEWVFNPNSGRIVRRDDMTQLIPYNYLVFSVTRYEEE
jgi:hypothetical protein